MKEEDYVPLPPPEPGKTWLVFPNSDVAMYVSESDIENLPNGQVSVKKGATAIIMERKLKSEAPIS